MKVSIYSREEIEKLISKGFPEKTAVISFYDPPNIRTGEISEPVDYKGLPERVFQVEVHDIDMETLEDFGLSFDTYFPEADSLAAFV